MQILPYIHFGGDCEEALNHYAAVFGGEIEMLMRWRDAPPDMQAPPDFQDKIMHACLRIEDARLMASDSPPAHFQPQQGVSISVDMADADKARTAFAALEAGGQVWMAFGPTFWAKGFGMLTDRFGTQWMISADQLG